MKLTCEQLGQITLVRVKGDMTAEFVGQFQEMTAAQMQNKSCDFVLEMSEVEFVDSKGLEAILKLQEVCGERLGQISLASIHPNIESILQITRLSARFDCHPDWATAAKRMSV